MAQADSLACNCNSVREIADTTIHQPVVDNNQNVYIHSIVMSPGASIVQLIAAYIEYTL